MQKVTPRSLEQLGDFIRKHSPALYLGSQTSTVLPYDHLKNFIKDEKFTLVDLGQMPKKMELTSSGDLLIRGPITWKDAKDFLRAEGREIMTSPTEELACILAGLATSATGERCFGFGTLRDQVREVTYLNYNGEECFLSASKKLASTPKLAEYQQSYLPYQSFKNAPFPRFANQADLMIGTEGQLGVITEVQIATAQSEPLTYIFIQLRPWEEDYSQHLEVYEKVQNYRDELLSVEMIDANSMRYLEEEKQLGDNEDILFLEVKTSEFEKIYEELFMGFDLVDESKIFEITKAKFHDIRTSVPRAIFEENSRMGVMKMGTDVQVRSEHYSKLFDHYRKFTSESMRYNLFGHFGDAHLHFNFMPAPEQIPQCEKSFMGLYDQVLDWKGSPFAEHGVGLIKQKYIHKFYSPVQKELFTQLKQEHDPHNQFFPQGFMS